MSALTEESTMSNINTQFLQQGENVVRKYTQNISDAFITALRKERDASLEQSEGEMMRVASVPMALAEQWQREGFDIYRENATAIMKRLKQQGMDAFLTTKKSI